MHAQRHADERRPRHQPVTIEWKALPPGDVERAGPWPTGVWFVKLTANDGRTGAPFVIRPTTLGERSRVAAVMSTNTWQAYNFATRTGTSGRHPVREGRPRYPRSGGCSSGAAYRRSGESTTSTSSAVEPDGQAARHPDRVGSRDDPTAELISHYDSSSPGPQLSNVTRHEYDLMRTTATSAATSLSSRRTTFRQAAAGRTLRRMPLARYQAVPSRR